MKCPMLDFEFMNSLRTVPGRAFSDRRTQRSREASRRQIPGIDIASGGRFGKADLVAVAGTRTREVEQSLTGRVTDALLPHLGHQPHRLDSAGEYER